MTAQIPGYDLLEPLGSGGSGTVYQAIRRSDGSPVAIKLIRPELVDPTYLDRLRQEARLTGSIEHPGVIRVHEVGGTVDQAWLVMDRLTGPDLQRMLDETGPLPADRAAEVLAQVADAVDAVHQADVVHRDIKPANIVFDDGRPLVGDFGVARQLTALETTTGLAITGGKDWARTGAPSSGPALGTAAGTVAYMAPEQWRGDPASAQTDVYALGGTLYAALTGHPPFEQRSLPELAYAVAMLPAPEASRLGAPPAYDGVISTAMAKDPADRFDTAADFATAVRGAAKGLPHKAKRRARRPKIVLAAAALTLAVVGTTLAIWAASGPEQVELIVCANDATVRDAPRSRTVLATVRRGDRLPATIEDEGAPWVKVELPDGRTGWALTNYVRRQC